MNQIDLSKTKNYSFKILGLTIFCAAISDGIGWFRIFGNGLHWKDTTKHKMLFSERNNLRKQYRIKKYLFRFLNSK
jgi:hypothetical protein